MRAIDFFRIVVLLNSSDHRVTDATDAVWYPANGGLAFFGILSLARTLSPMWRSWSLGLRLALALALAFLRAFDS